MKAAAALFSLLLLQAQPGYVREGDRVAEHFVAYREILSQFFSELEHVIRTELPPEEADTLLRQLDKAPPPVGVYGYGMLPRIVEIAQPPTPIRNFSYSWPITEGYIRNEESKLEQAKDSLAKISGVTSKIEPLSDLVKRYREFVRNQATVDQYIEYNRFWQRTIAEERSRYDRMTQIYWNLKTGNPDTAAAIREILGRPQAPRFIRVQRQGDSQVVLHVRLYTDIRDDAWLAHAKSVIEDTWKIEDRGVRYAVEVDLRKISPSDLYRGRNEPAMGDHIDIDKHIDRFPKDGGVLTTGAEFTYGSLGRAIVLGPGDLAPKTLAHEFGHILGFNDGYVRGYSDLGEKGFEILEITAFLDDIMSAPREGHVQATHFTLMLEALR